MAESAQDIIYGFLDKYGLGSLASWAWNLYLNGASVEEIRLALPEQPDFKKRFPAYEQLAKEGRAISPDTYMAYEERIRADMSFYSIPSGMYDTPEGIAKLLLSDVSVEEAKSRMSLAANAAFSAPQEVRDALRDRYGLSENDLIAYYLDPEKALPIITQQYVSAQIVGAAEAQKVSVETELAERLSAQGVTYAQAQQGFGQVAQMDDLTAQEQGGSVTQGDLVKGVFGDGRAASKVEAEARRRAAQYQSSEGGAAISQRGVSGVGSAAS